MAVSDANRHNVKTVLTLLEGCALKTIADLLNRAKAASSLASDYQLAKILDVPSGRVSDWRAERRYPSHEQLLTLVEMANDDLAYWLIIMLARKAPNAKLANKMHAAAESITV